jgi:hypothetical protein
VFEGTMSTLNGNFLRFALFLHSHGFSAEDFYAWPAQPHGTHQYSFVYSDDQVGKLPAGHGRVLTCMLGEFLKACPVKDGHFNECQHPAFTFRMSNIDNDFYVFSFKPTDKFVLLINPPI